MDGFALLLTLFGAAVTFAGFLSVVVLIDRKAAGVSADLVSFRVRAIITFVLVVMMLTTLPFFLNAFGLDADMTWRWSSGVGAAITVVVIGSVCAVVVKRHLLNLAAAVRFGASQFYISTLAGVAVVALMSGGAAGFIAPAASYLLGVFWYVLTIAILFLRLVFLLDDTARNRE